MSHFRSLNMTVVTLKGNPLQLYGIQPLLGKKALEFHLTNSKLETVSLSQSKGKKRILSIFPSLDTGVCLTMNKHLNELAKSHPTIQFYAISCDLPFAASRICGLEKIEHMQPLSMMHNKQFGMDYGLLLTSGPLHGLLTRALIYIDALDIIQHVEIVSEITNEPDYQALLKVIQ
jgi:thiol peroxidase